MGMNQSITFAPKWRALHILKIQVSPSVNLITSLQAIDLIDQLHPTEKNGMNMQKNKYWPDNRLTKGTTYLLVDKGESKELDSSCLHHSVYHRKQQQHVSFFLGSAAGCHAAAAGQEY
jgi:hypothetical protein